MAGDETCENDGTPCPLNEQKNGYDILVDVKKDATPHILDAV